MCYASSVMLRGRCSCAISERPTPSLFATPSLFRTLSPIIPVHRRHSTANPIIPVHTQKQGGGGGIIFACYSPCRLLSPIIPVHRRHSPVSPIIPVHTQKQGGWGWSTYMVTYPKYVGAPTFSFRESIIAIHQNARSSSALAVNCQLSTVNCPSPAPFATAALRVVPAPIYTTTSSIHVGAPTILPSQGRVDNPRNRPSR